MRPKYKELYEKQKLENKDLLKEIEYYTQALNYMKEKGIIKIYEEKIVPDLYSNNFLKKIFLKVDNNYYYQYVKVIDDNENI